MKAFTVLLTLVAGVFTTGVLSAHEGNPAGVIVTTPNQKVRPSFDLVNTRVTVAGNVATFHLQVSGKAGGLKPTPSGKLAGSQVFAYVWPTNLDPALVGFDPQSGILAFAVTSHPDFDDTPLFDENGDGKLNNDGEVWHSHWVVLVQDPEGKKGDLKVQDIPSGKLPRLPKTWPGLPILIDSPGWNPIFQADSLDVKVPFDTTDPLVGAAFDGVTSALTVNADLHSPLLRITGLFKVASGTLSLPGRVTQ